MWLTKLRRGGREKKDSKREIVIEREEKRNVRRKSEGKEREMGKSGREKREIDKEGWGIIWSGGLDASLEKWKHQWC